MEVSILKTIVSEFNQQDHKYGLLFGYNAGNENYLISFLAPSTFQQLPNELNEDKKNDILNIAEDLHNSVNGYSLLGFIAKENEQITQQALIMKAQEYYVALQKRLKIKGSFYLCYINSASFEILEKKQGQVFTKVNHKEFEEKELTQVNSLIPLNIEQVFSEKESQSKTIIDQITDVSQSYLGSLTNSIILLNNLLITNDTKSLSELCNTAEVQLQFIESSTTQAQEQFYQRPYYFRFNGLIEISFKSYKDLPIQNLKTIIINAVRKELETRMYQVFGEQFAQKSLSETEEIQLPSKYQSNQFKNITLSIYTSHPSIQDYGSCIFSSLQEAEKMFNQEFNGKKLEFKQVDQLQISVQGSQTQSKQEATKNVESNKEQKQIDPSVLLKQQEQRKQQISYLVFSLVIALLAYIYMKI
ncbi:transmembrane protein, putative (macronuclear) [Tetrahymena thermophila SB210]|uniref:Transmembrane protein, putative n=1 Tax=Tetrahymena thermophila (strain SB210) TaxID=312017 RepID=I7MFT5_TETTS|nr:transmembrane protein, putative [Tetrahymena thermophila SB210]EAS00576.2 transmembrane protein, putative [Tetrahymena thermophila SB210]|eukprot:XP_001020821.2 transmembrane protein, putative [Tetrahymena thermophila SB210]